MTNGSQQTLHLTWRQLSGGNTNAAHSGVTRPIHLDFSGREKTLTVKMSKREDRQGIPVSYTGQVEEIDRCRDYVVTKAAFIKET